jgi:hypothetical protein
VPDEFVIDTRAFRSARVAYAPRASLNRKGNPRVALWLGVTAAGIVALNAAYEAAEDLVDCVLTFGGDCEED